VPETPEQFWERARAGLQTPPVEEWDSWPFRGTPTPRELEPPVAEEPPRHGVGGVDCRHCTPTNVVWSDENWVLRSLDKPSGLPVVVLLETKRHVDFPDLDDALAAELGPLLLRIERAVALVPGVGRVHVGRWGEGSEHCHIWFMGRTARMMQFRSSFAAIWDDVLPPTPEDVWRENVDLVRAALDGEVAGP
jgi:diadenosine tetraphosphate (Ap4A) HIT family hydrolase